MDAPSSRTRALSAPGASGCAARQLPGRADAPRLDEPLVRPETREEMIDGRLIQAMPAREPHADRHCELDYVLRGSIARGYTGSSDLLTRAGPTSEFATDCCIRRSGIDPRTGTRYLEELAFEIVHKQSLASATKRAKLLTTRGVRRVLAIMVRKGEVREWSPDGGSWFTLDLEGELVDRTLARPVPIRALLDAAEADNAVASALLSKKNPVIAAALKKSAQEGVQEGRKQGVQEGLKQGAEQALTQGIEALCKELQIPLGPARRAQLRQLDVAGLSTLLAQLGATHRWP